MQSRARNKSKLGACFRLALAQARPSLHFSASCFSAGEQVLIASVAAKLYNLKERRDCYERYERGISLC